MDLHPGLQAAITAGAAATMGYLTYRGLRTGVIYSRFGILRREQEPRAYWFTVGLSVAMTILFVAAAVAFAAGWG